MIRVVVCGAGGAMGKVLVAEINRSSNFELAGILSPQKGVEDVSWPADVIIDFSHHENSSYLADYAVAHRLPLLICTTGQSEDDLRAFAKAGGQVAVLCSPNTSVGVNVLLKMLSDMAPELSSFDARIVEVHHTKKKDAPSGTAKALKRAVEESSGREDVEILSLRAGTVPGEHTVIFAGDDEVIEIKHSALSKRIFATGALNLAQRLITMKPRFYTMEDM